MILSGPAIIHQIEKTRDIVIDPFVKEHVGPNSVDLTLGDTLLVYENRILDMKKEQPTRTIKIPPDGFVLEPLQLYLGVTQEVAGSKENFVPHVDGRSSVGRLGISVHVTAGRGDTGFVNHWTLEIYCLQPVRIYAGVRICQISFTAVMGDRHLYTGKYAAQAPVPVASRFYKDFEVRP